MTVVLEMDPATFRGAQSYSFEPYSLDPGFTPWTDRLHFLLWANNVDLRGPVPVWWWAKKAERLGATLCSTGDGDVVLPDGSAVWIDGGPRDNRLAATHTIIHSETVDLGRLDTMSPSPQPTAVLAADQLAAVGHAVGPARIIAPAGSGKTRVLTERLRRCIRLSLGK